MSLDDLFDSDCYMMVEKVRRYDEPGPRPQGRDVVFAVLGVRRGATLENALSQFTDDDPDRALAVALAEELLAILQQVDGDYGRGSDADEYLRRYFDLPPVPPPS